MLGPKGSVTIRLEGVSRCFGDIVVIRDATLTIDAGQVAAFVGENGAGKTTLLRMIGGSLTPDTGRVVVDGSQGAMGFVPAGERGSYWRLTSRANLEFFARIGGIEPRDVSARVEAAAAAMGATNLLEQRLVTCSTGQRRRVMLAQAAVAAPSVLLMDEPFADLDGEGIESVRSLFSTWTQAGGSAIYAAPSAGDGPAADRHFTLSDGLVRSWEA